MNILVINCGSSSIKAAVVDAKTGARAEEARIERVGTDESVLRWGSDTAPCHAPDHATALDWLLPRLIEAAGDDAVVGVGHRVVHGGEPFTEPTRIDDQVEAAIEALIPLAPLHNPPNLQGIRAARRALPDLPHVAVFDTAFHATLPPSARTYALPVELAESHGVRRYGFHGTSHAFVAAEAARHLGEDLRDLRIITCHLGNGASVAAVEHGRSVDTSMGMTPLEGLVMGTRSGDVDPGALLAILRAKGWGADELDHLLNKESGLAGLSGVGNDFRDIEERAADGDARCQLAVHVFTHRLRHYIGAYAAVMGGVDVIVFTGGIGQNSALVRNRAAQRLEFLGARLDEERNRGARATEQTPVVEISTAHSRVRLLAVRTDEEREIAHQTARLVDEADKVGDSRSIPVAISARHIHLTPEAVEVLFGPGAELTPRVPLSQPGQFAAEQRLTILGPKRSLERVAIVGPTRKACQVEISRTDEFHLGLDAPVRDSGDVANSPGITLRGPAGELTLREGVICARRHIHMTPEDAEYFGVKDRDVVEVAIDSEGRDLTFGDVLVRVKSSYALEMHIDTDEGNAAELSTGDEAVLEATPGRAHIQRRTVRYD